MGVAETEKANVKGKILANVVKQYTAQHGGIIPVKAAEHHVEVCDKSVREALAAAKINIRDVNVIAFSQGPGIGHCLRVGAAAAKTLALFHKKSLIGVNHCIAHLEIGKLLTKAQDPVLLYVSGANTQVIAFENNRYRVLGETLDIGVGNLLDVFARELGLGFPGGPKVMRLAEKGRNYIELPYVVKGMDANFGGILTNIIEKFRSGKYSKEDLCYSLQETVFAMLVEIAERALAATGKEELLLGGGVSCNTRLQEMCRVMCEDRSAKLFVPENQFLVDNGAMIAWLGILEFLKGKKIAAEKAVVRPYWRTDED